jgi:hypothetical protein
MSPETRLVATYRMAIQNVPWLILEKVSHSKVENVEYAPTKPIGTRNRHDGLRSAWWFKNSRDNPMMKQAVMLMTNVPNGNLVPIRPATVVPTQKRAAEPRAPPSMMNRYLCKFYAPICWTTFRESLSESIHCNRNSRTPSDGGLTPGPGFGLVVISVMSFSAYWHPRTLDIYQSEIVIAGECEACSCEGILPRRKTSSAGDPCEESSSALERAAVRVNSFTREPSATT